MFVCVCRRARILLDVPRFCEEQSLPGGRERRSVCPKTESGPISGARACVNTICIPSSC